MPLDEIELMLSLGRLQEGVAGLQRSFAAQGERIQSLENKVAQHLESKNHNGNGNGWRQDVAKYGGGAGAGGAVLLLIEWLSKHV